MAPRAPPPYGALRDPGPDQPQYIHDLWAADVASIRRLSTNGTSYLRPNGQMPYIGAKNPFVKAPNTHSNQLLDTMNTDSFLKLFSINNLAKFQTFLSDTACLVQFNEERNPKDRYE